MSIARTLPVWFALLTAAVSVAAAGTESWSDATAAALLKQLQRADAPAREIVAIRCGSPTGDAELDRACDRLRHELARSISRGRFDVVEPRNGFASVESWDHVACGAGQPGDHLGWNIVEIRLQRIDPRRQWRDLVQASAHATGSGALLHEETLSLTELGELPSPGVEEPAAPFVISHQAIGGDRFASYLAERLVCALKELPNKQRIDEVRVVGRPVSPAQIEWVEQLGHDLAAHLNRVLDSGYVGTGTATLELMIEPAQAGLLRVTPRIFTTVAGLLADRVAVDGAAVCRGHECTVELDDYDSAYLGDLDLFAGDITALRAHVMRHNLTPIVEYVASDRPAGTVVRQRPGPGARLDKIRGRRVLVEISTGLARAGNPLAVLIQQVGSAMGVSPAAVRECVRATEPASRVTRALDRLLREHDPRDRRDSELPAVWRAWYEFVHPLYEPYFPDSPIGGFTAQIERALFERLEKTVFEGDRGGKR